MSNIREQSGTDYLFRDDRCCPVPHEKFEVWIVWGTTLRDKPRHYEFETLAELNAFRIGIDEGEGWLSNHQFISEDEALKYYNHHPDTW